MYGKEKETNTTTFFIFFFLKSGLIMAQRRNIGKEIIRLRTEENLSYPQIQKRLNCSFGAIYYHCDKLSLNDTGMKKYPVDDFKKKEIEEYCKTHNIQEAVNHFKLSLSTIKKYKIKKKRNTQNPNENQ